MNILRGPNDCRVPRKGSRPASQDAQAVWAEAALAWQIVLFAVVACVLWIYLKLRPNEEGKQRRWDDRVKLMRSGLYCDRDNDVAFLPNSHNALAAEEYTGACFEGYKEGPQSNSLNRRPESASRESTHAAQRRCHWLVQSEPSRQRNTHAKSTDESEQPVRSGSARVRWTGRTSSRAAVLRDCCHQTSPGCRLPPEGSRRRLG